MRQRVGGNRRIRGRRLGRLKAGNGLGGRALWAAIILTALHPTTPHTRPGEACWWTMHPASKQRSEGEKVRVGDDLILVSVSSERYLVSNPTSSQLPLPPGLEAHGVSPSASLVSLVSGLTVLTPIFQFPDL